MWSRLARALRFATLGFLATGLILTVDVHAQGPFTAQTQLALDTLKATANSWTGTQTFTNVVINGTCTGSGCSGGGGGAPTTATYITQTPNGSLSANQALSTLATGILKSTTATGVVSIASAGTDYLAPTGSGTGLVYTTGSITGLGGNFSTVGAFTMALTATGNTAVTLPTSGTLQTTTGTPAGFVIASQATGDILYASSASVWSRLPKGSDTNVLTLAAGIPSWAAAGAAAAGSLTGTTLASNVVTSSLTSVGTLTGLVTSGTITGATDIYTTAWTDYAGSSTIVGWSSTTDKFILYKQIGKTVFVNFYIVGTSNSTSTTFTLPLATANTSANFNYTTVLGFSQDAGANTTTSGKLQINSNSSTVTLYSSATYGAWTASLTKGVGGQFWYQTP